jgi:DNA damage-binding protein 1
MVGQATVELGGIRGLWSLRPSTSDAFDSFMVLTFVGETRLLAMNDEDELEEAEPEGFDADSQVDPPLPPREAPLTYLSPSQISRSSGFVWKIIRPTASPAPITYPLALSNLQIFWKF